MSTARTDEEKKAEQEKRQRDQEKNEKSREAAMRFYAEAHGVQGWKKVNKKDASDLTEDEKRFEDGGASISNSNSARGLYGKGIYSNLQPGSTIHIDLDENGKAKPLIDHNWYGIVTDKEWEKAFSETMDFLAVGRGNKNILLDWDDKGSVSRKYLTKLMDLAEGKGLAVTFSPTVIAALNDPLQFSKKEREAFYARKTVMYEKMVKNDQFIDATTHHSFGKHAESFNQADNKLTGVDDATKKANSQTRVVGAVGAPGEKEKEERVDLISKEIDALNKRVAELDLAKKELEAYVALNTKNLDDTNPNNTFLTESSSKVIGITEDQLHNKALPLIASMQKEMDDLKLRAENWKAEFTAPVVNAKQLSRLKVDYQDELALIPNPPVFPADITKKEKLEAQIRKIDDMSAKLNQADQNLTDMRNGKIGTPADPNAVVTKKLTDVRDEVVELRDKAVTIRDEKESQERASLKK